ncbi:hypothetical protein F0562_016196 [Nyssa sinensis]|uniref:Uncharacterized protein n=1 Tax=Nyssa sinensis TaxID=561372 RepID=A0A5J4ZK20_9ASTE|nr:hypothetical protein F0562_016196 [Nyssa sinensis]
MQPTSVDMLWMVVVSSCRPEKKEPALLSSVQLAVATGISTGGRLTTIATHVIVLPYLQLQNKLIERNAGAV